MPEAVTTPAGGVTNVVRERDVEAGVEMETRTDGRGGVRPI